MSVRHRSIAGAPHRPAGEAASKVTEMVTETLAAAADVNQADVVAELGEALLAVRSLIAAKHLADDPIVLVADPLRLEIRVVHGSASLSLNEQLGRVTGAAKATDWSMHVPRGATLGASVVDALAGLQHVTIASPPKASESVAAASVASPGLDLEALRRVGGGQA